MSHQSLSDLLFLSESAKGDQETIEVSRLMLNAFKEVVFVQELQLSPQPKFPFKLTIPVTDDSTLIIVVDPAYSTESPKILSADHSPMLGTTRVFVGVPPTRLPKQTLRNFLSELQSIIQHELEHKQQVKRMGEVHGYFGKQHSYPSSVVSSGAKTLLDVEGYYLHPKEVEAHVKQFRRKAQFNKLPIMQVIEDEAEVLSRKLETKFPGENISGVIQKIKEVWLNHARFRFQVKHS